MSRVIGVELADLKGLALTTSIMSRKHRQLCSKLEIADKNALSFNASELTFKMSGASPHNYVFPAFP